MAKRINVGARVFRCINKAGCTSSSFPEPLLMTTVQGVDKSWSMGWEDRSSKMASVFFISRGVLLDVASYRGVDWIEADQPVTREDVEAVCKHQEITIHQGDIVLVRTGNGALWKDPSAYLASGGIRADASQWFADQKVKAVGADHTAWDTVGFVDPDLGISFPGHLILLVRHGIYIMENLFLEDLSRDQVYEFLFVCLPLKMKGVTGSPIRPIAVISQG
jgi:kynurenine formamidase